MVDIVIMIVSFIVKAINIHFVITIIVKTLIEVIIVKTLLEACFINLKLVKNDFKKCYFMD